MSDCRTYFIFSHYIGSNIQNFKNTVGMYFSVSFYSTHKSYVPWGASELKKRETELWCPTLQCVPIY